MNPSHCGTSTEPDEPGGFDGHHLLVGSVDLDGNVPWVVTHPDGCPQVVQYEAPDGNHVMRHDCGVGFEIDMAGVDAFHLGSLTDPIRNLPFGPGRYRIVRWTHRTGSGPWGPSEFSSGLDVVRDLDGDPVGEPLTADDIEDLR